MHVDKRGTIVKKMHVDMRLMIVKIHKSEHIEMRRSI